MLRRVLTPLVLILQWQGRISEPCTHEGAEGDEGRCRRQASSASGRRGYGSVYKLLDLLSVFWRPLLRVLLMSGQGMQLNVLPEF